jgi:hypothetical protein
MNSPDAFPSTAPPPARPPEDPGAEDTGLPGLRTWRAVYGVVMGCFLLWVILLVALEVVFR